MDYQLNIYPSSERDLQNVKALNHTKVIKSMGGEQKLAAAYKKTFTPAVKKYNERAISGKLIDDYYKAILASNIPEVYKLTLVIRYELLNKAEIAAIDKAFTAFKNILSKEPYLVIVAAYSMSFEEFKEMQIYFYPVCENYVSGLAARNDLIDLTKQIFDSKENLTIKTAMPLFVQHIDGLFQTVNNGQFYSQAELEAMANRAKDEADPLSLHSIAVETLKGQMNSLQQVNAENCQLEEMIEKEKERIQNDIVWVKVTEEKILKAEEERVRDEERKMEALRRAEAERLAKEAAREEEERLRVEERKYEAARLAEIARRNVELRRQMSLDLGTVSAGKNTEINVDVFGSNHDAELITHAMNELPFDQKVEQHIKWQEFYEITEDTKIEDIPKHALEDVRRLNLTNETIENVALHKDLILIGASFKKVKFIACTLPVKLVSSSVTECEFIRTDISFANLDKCMLDQVELKGMVVEGLKVEGTTIIRSDFEDCHFKDASGINGTNFTKTSFKNNVFEKCDMKQSVFATCDLSNTKCNECDFREATFQTCKIDGMEKHGSIFRGVKYL